MTSPVPPSCRSERHQHRAPPPPIWVLLPLAPIILFGLSVAWAEDGVRRSAQPLVVKPLQTNQASKRNHGSAGSLRGTVVIADIFLEDDGSQWSTVERREISRRMDVATAFLTNQAKVHGQSVTFTRSAPLLLSWHEPLPIDSTVHPAWTTRVIEGATGHAPGEHLAHLRKAHEADSALFALHVDKSALSYNLASYLNIAEEFSAERMICFSRYPDGRETADATYAHEILHLFGAGDLYFPYDPDGNRKRAAESKFPRDVMLRVDYDISRLNAGEFTAFRVGWRDSLEPSLRAFED